MTTKDIPGEFRFLPTFVASRQTALSPESVAAPPPAFASDPPTAEEIQRVHALASQYSAYPGVGQGLAQGLGSNPNDVGPLLREFETLVEQIRANPHRQFSPHPALRAALTEVQQAELSKPDPLNMLRGEGQVVPTKALAAADITTASVTDPVLQAANVESRRQRDVQDEEGRMRNSWRTIPGASGGLPTSFGNINAVGAAPSDNMSLADALDYVREAGPGPTPGKAPVREQNTGRFQA